MFSRPDLRLFEHHRVVFLTQIVGLTATPGSGPASNVDSAVDHVIQLLANLNVMTPPVEVAGSDMPFCKYLDCFSALGMVVLSEKVFITRRYNSEKL